MNQFKELANLIAVCGLIFTAAALIARQQPLHADLRLLDAVRCNDFDRVKQMLKPCGVWQKFKQRVWHGRPLWCENCYLSISIAVDSAVQNKNASMLDLLLDLDTQIVLDDYEEIDTACIQSFIQRSRLDVGNVILDHCMTNYVYMQLFFHQLNKQWFVSDRLYNYLREANETKYANVLKRFTLIKGKQDIIALCLLKLPCLLVYNVAQTCLEPYSHSFDAQLLYFLIKMIKELY